MSTLKIDPNFVVPEPTPADFFAWAADPGTPEARQQVIRETFDRWKAEGGKQGRVTLTGLDIEGDDTGYPPGLWLEGWKDAHAKMLPFGAAWPNEDSAIWPPLTYAKEDA